MLRHIPLIAFVTLSACAVPIAIPVPAPAPAPVPAPPEPTVNPGSAKERFLRAAEAYGCEVNAQNSSLILSGATLSEQDLARILTELKSEGRGDVNADGTGFRVTTGACA